MSQVVYDAAFSTPSMVAAAHARGAVGMNYYVRGDHARTSTKPATAHAAGMGSLATDELHPGALVGITVAAGAAIGRQVLAALGAAGYPPNSGIAVYCSVDVNVAAGNVSRVHDGFEGLHKVLSPMYSLRAYAEGKILDYLAANHLVDGPGWLAGASSWPGYDPDDHNVCLVQHVGSDIRGTDLNVVTQPDKLGMWMPAGSDDEMTPAQYNEMIKRFDELEADNRAIRATMTAYMYDNDPHNPVPYANKHLMGAIVGEGQSDTETPPSTS